MIPAKSRFLPFILTLLTQVAWASNLPAPAAQVAIYKPTQQLVKNPTAASVSSEFFRTTDGSRIKNYSAASLVDGTLRIAGSDELSPLSTNYTDANASWWDWITFSAPGASFLQIPIALHVSGTLAGLAGINFGFYVGDYYTTSYQQLAVRWTTPNMYGGQYTTGTSSFLVSTAIGQWQQIGKEDFIGTVTVPVGVPVFWNMFLNGRSGNYDFAHTASFDWVLPSGATFASQSGVFLSAVPEPSAALLWLVSASLFLLAARRDRYGTYHPY